VLLNNLNRLPLLILISQVLAPHDASNPAAGNFFSEKTMNNRVFPPNGKRKVKVGSLQSSTFEEGLILMYL
jgi:hypothetical protein